MTNSISVSQTIQPLFMKHLLFAALLILNHASAQRHSQADSLLKTRPSSVVEKKLTPPSGDKHDYLSLAPYFWPDQSKPDGKPYLRRDGKVNPESRNNSSDHHRMTKTLSAIDTLSRAFQETDNEAYAKKAAEFLNTWFLDPKTRMNPNLNFAQGVPGKVDGRCFGIIEGRVFIKAGYASTKILKSPAWSEVQHEGIKKWLAAYLDWLLTSKLGQEEGATLNNHASGYDVQVTEIAWFLGNKALVKKVTEEAKEKRIAAQIQPNGSQPHELKRTKSLGYCALNLSFLFDLADIATKVDVDLWHYESEDGRSLKKALEFLSPYLGPKAKKWPYQQISKPSSSRLASLYQKGGSVYHSDEFLALAKSLKSK